MRIFLNILSSQSLQYFHRVLPPICKKKFIPPLEVYQDIYLWISVQSQYADLLSPHQSVTCETATSYPLITERHLQALWLEQKYFKPLVTSEGLEIEVLSPGYWNAEAGPDFRMAHLKVGGTEWKGDIEIHLYDDSWYHHQHHLDPRYNQTVLHVGYWKPKESKPFDRECGQIPFAVHLQDFLTLPIQRLISMIDLDLYPYKKFLGSGRCATSLFSTLSQNELVHLFSSAAQWRLQAKHQLLQSSCVNPSDYFLAGVAMALGYKRNAAAFLNLFSHLAPYRWETEDPYLALALDACGWFGESYQEKWKHNLRFCHLKRLKTELGIALPKVQLDLANIRPLNHPIRRLALLAKLLCNRERPLQALFDQVWESGWKSYSTDPKGLHRALMSAFPDFQDSYWNRHYTFETPPQQQHVPLLGEDLKQTILVNVYFPILDHAIKTRSVPQEDETFLFLYHSLSGQESGKLRYLSHRFFGDNTKKEVLSSLITQQGAYQVHRDFCMHFEASCVGCPFVERYEEEFRSAT